MNTINVAKVHNQLVIQECNSVTLLHHPLLQKELSRVTVLLQSLWG